MKAIDSITDCPPLPEGESAEFRHIPEYPGYAAGNDGSVLSCHPRGWQTKPLYWRNKAININPVSGYRQTHIQVHGKTTGMRVATLVLLAFHGSRPLNLVGCHNDGSKTNDIPRNLRWDTLQANTQDSIKHGTFDGFNRKGDASPVIKVLTEEIATVQKLGAYLSVSKIAMLYGISNSYASKLVRGVAPRQVAD